MNADGGVQVALVTVACSDSHTDDQPTCYWTFIRQMGRFGAVWVESSREGALIELIDGEPRHRGTRPRVVKILDQDGKHRHGLSATAGRGYRRHFDFKCNSCKFTLPSPAERIEPVFDRIAAAASTFPVSLESGAPELGLRTLAAMLRS
ncbi:hypothetical protein [Mycobacterium sp.]|uniref:hypothetical protein n=1 Tax=Mycobacterium sp. TaxID=1785 RepID=UPI003D11CA67